MSKTASCPLAVIKKLVAVIGADDPVTFGGRIEPSTAKGFMAKRMANGPMAGDYRDWPKIREWAGQVSRSLHERTPHAGRT